MNLNQLLYFSVTARHQHFTRAAEELFISQPSLSYAISSLEDELGVALFQKKGRNVQLTKQGELFLTHVERALSEIHQGREAISRMISETENRISIAAFSTNLGSIELPALMREFSSDPQNSEVRFQFSQCSEADMLSGLKSMKHDVAFLQQCESDPDIEFIPLTTQPLCAIVSAAHPLSRQTAVTPQQLEAFPLLLHENSPCSHKIQRLLPDAAITCHAQDPLTLMSLAAADFGVAIALNSPQIAQNNLHALPITGADCDCTICIAYKKNRYLPPVLESFLNYLKSLTESPKNQ